MSWHSFSPIPSIQVLALISVSLPPLAVISLFQFFPFLPKLPNLPYHRVVQLIACCAGRHMIHHGSIRTQSLPFHVGPKEGALKSKEPST